MTHINSDIVVLIPAYNEAATIRDLVERALKIVPNVTEPPTMGVPSVPLVMWQLSRSVRIKS